MRDGICGLAFAGLASKKFALELALSFIALRNAVQFIEIGRTGFAMAIETSKLTIRLPVEDVRFVKRYAKANGLSVTEVIDRYLRRMRLLDNEAPPAALDEITGLLPADLDADAEMRERQSVKHGQ